MFLQLLIWYMLPIIIVFIAVGIVLQYRKFKAKRTGTIQQTTNDTKEK